MKKRLDYIILDIHLFFESLFWTVLDLVRASRMRHSKRMHERYKPAKEADQSEADIKK